MQENLVVVGHSLGNLLAMRLAEKHFFRKMILVSAWDYDDLYEGHESSWKTKINHSKIKEHVGNICVIHSDNDPYYTALAAEDTSKRLEAKSIYLSRAAILDHKKVQQKCPLSWSCFNFLFNQEAQQ